MAQRDPTEDGLPWDPLWAYVLGEDDDEDRDRHSMDESDLRPPERRLDETRDTSESAATTSNAPRTFWKRLRRESSSAGGGGGGGGGHRESRDEEQETWQWELDTSPFLLTDDTALSSPSRKSLSTAKNKEPKKSDDSSWMGLAVWRDPRKMEGTATPRSLLRKSA
jgi:hypothetical protein